MKEQTKSTNTIKKPYEKPEIVTTTTVETVFKNCVLLLGLNAPWLLTKNIPSYNHFLSEIYTKYLNFKIFHFMILKNHIFFLLFLH